MSAAAVAVYALLDDLGPGDDSVARSRGYTGFVREHHAPTPSLLHGDLWSGNASFTNDGTPVIYDPACYFGDRECDLAFTEMFGGFPGAFRLAEKRIRPIKSEPIEGATDGHACRAK